MTKNTSKEENPMPQGTTKEKPDQKKPAEQISEPEGYAKFFEGVKKIDIIENYEPEQSTLSPQQGK
jgi:hypothetical protein